MTLILKIQPQKACPLICSLETWFVTFRTFAEHHLFQHLQHWTSYFTFLKYPNTCTNLRHCVHICKAHSPKFVHYLVKIIPLKFLIHNLFDVRGFCDFSSTYANVCILLENDGAVFLTKKWFPMHFFEKPRPHRTL